MTYPKKILPLYIIIYIHAILTGMKRISITVDEETLNLLEGKVNKSETIRKALEIYNGDVSTDTLAGMRQAFRTSLQKQEEFELSVNERLEYMSELLEKLNNKVPDQF